MTPLQEAIDVPLPAAATQDNILRYFASRRREDGTSSISLRVPLREFGLPNALDIEHQVEVHVAKQRDLENINEEIAVSWAPAEDGPYPKFSGRLIVWSEEHPEKSFIELRGEYEPPLGDAGRLFDAAIGKDVAQRTAQAFLADLRDAVIATQRLTAQQ
jgi:hypothetical protein